MRTDITNILPEECISYILSLTSPTDVCRSKLVSPVFRSAADSDTIWGKFLPSDCYDIISNASSSSSSKLLTSSMSKAQLYFHLCKNPIIIDNEFWPQQGKNVICWGLDGFQLLGQTRLGTGDGNVCLNLDSRKWLSSKKCGG
ncbi:putative F-box protein PP2-B12 isoform X3 [Gossypium hirsutum]|uniref:F-box protein PP2-B12 isoform X3 n=1 Tax=Gossypium hirsutum TaxID=3635 RepID=A0ABM3AS61_GOSHI|nr:putative F-box protein PP2-B12 isoform X3 [Gossypium hirsutum]